jgi:hypothetical protein
MTTGTCSVGDPDGLDGRLRREGMGREVRALDLSALHVSVLDDRLGIGPDEIAAGTRLAYTRSESDARERVAAARRPPPSWCGRRASISWPPSPPPAT